MLDGRVSDPLCVTTLATLSGLSNKHYLTLSVGQELNRTQLEASVSVSQGFGAVDSIESGPECSSVYWSPSVPGHGDLFR